MCMRVDKSREQETAGRVKELAAVFRQPLPDLYDAAALDQHVGRARLARRYDAPVFNQNFHIKLHSAAASWL